MPLPRHLFPPTSPPPSLPPQIARHIRAVTRDKANTDSSVTVRIQGSHYADDATILAASALEVSPMLSSFVDNSAPAGITFDRSSVTLTASHSICGSTWINASGSSVRPRFVIASSTLDTLGARLHFPPGRASVSRSLGARRPPLDRAMEARAFAFRNPSAPLWLCYTEFRAHVLPACLYSIALRADHDIHAIGRGIGLYLHSSLHVAPESESPSLLDCARFLGQWPASLVVMYDRLLTAARLCRSRFGLNGYIFVSIIGSYLWRDDGSSIVDRVQ